MTLGVIVGYRPEADCLDKLNNLSMACSGADAARARAGAERLRDEGARALLSFGLAGGLAAHMQPGDLLLPETVILPGAANLETDAAWRGRLVSLLRQGRVSMIEGPIAGSDRLLATPQAKRALFQQTGAVAVDMESHAVAAVAAEAGLPFLVVRAVADRSDQAIPAAAHHAIDANGEIRHLAVLRGLMTSPWQIGALIALGSGSRRGLSRLRRVAALAPGLGIV